MSAETHTIILSISGMSCSGCSSRVQKALQSVAGVRSAVVDLESAKATIEVGADGPMEDLLISAVVKTGYEAAPVHV